MKKNYLTKLPKNKEFGLIVSNSLRSKIFLDKLINNKILPQQIFVFSKRKFILNKNISSKCKIFYFNTDDINNLQLINKILKSELYNFIYSGYPGQIIKNKKILKKKNLVHCHPGKLPYYKGSTVPYYQYLNESYLTYTVFKMSYKVDSGKEFFKEKIYPNKNFIKNFNKFDAYNRIEMIIKVIKTGFKFSLSKNNSKNSNYYFVAHPVIRALAVKKFNKIN